MKGGENMWKIVDKTKTSYDDSFEHVAFTNDATVAKAFRESNDYEVTKVNFNSDAMGIEVYSRHTWFEVLVPNTQNKYVTFRLVGYFSNYEEAMRSVGSQYAFRTIHKESDLIVERASELY